MAGLMTVLSSPAQAQITGACCAPDGSCTLTEETPCADVWLGAGTDCDPNCCPQVPTGSDCACETRVCRDDTTQELTSVVCAVDEDCGGGYSCVTACTPTGVTILPLPHTCHDASLVQVTPAVSCDPENGDADCTAVDPSWTCRQSFDTSASTPRSGTIAPSFSVAQGDYCTLGGFNHVGWYELFELHDRTPGDTTDDCFVLTAGLCCNDPVYNPVWPYLSEFGNCPCEPGDVIERIVPDADGFPPTCNAAHCCDDGNYAVTFTLPPGEYAYEIQAALTCAGSTDMCVTDEDCPGTPCEVARADYAVQFTVDSCVLGACCLGDACIVTNRLDCDTRLGHFLGDADPAVTSCPPDVTDPCVTGACCIGGNCQDDATVDTEAECLAQGGEYFAGGATCADDPCPVCPIDMPANCQQVQSVFGPSPLADRNNDSVVADDIIFNGTVVDDICWHVGMLDFNDQQCAQGTGFDDTWEIRVYESDATGGIPGTEICLSTLTVLNKLEGAGQATSTWTYSGQLDTPCALPNGGIGGDKYWVEVSAFGNTGCAVHATWSRDDGNEHAAWQYIIFDEERLGYSPDQVLNYDIGFCEDDGIVAPDPVLGACCICAMNNCMDNLTQSECLDDLHGEWTPGGTCAAGECAEIPPNDDCANAIPVSGVPEWPADFPATLQIVTNNVCATDDGPPLDPIYTFGNCALSVTGGGDMHDDIWFSYVAEQCGWLRITSCGLAADYDQMIAIYDGDAGCPLTTDDELACNDDACEQGQAGPSELDVAVTAGQPLLVRVGGWNNEVPGGFLGHPHGYMVLIWSYVSLCPLSPPLPAPPPHDILKNRYISVDALTPNSTSELHLRLTMTSTLVNGAPVGGVYWAGQPDANCISLVTPTKPAIVPDWTACPIVHLTGCPIIPTSTYEIHAVSDQGEVSDTALVASTQALPTGSKWWGDCVGSFDPVAEAWTDPDGLVSINDAVAAIKTFQNPSAVGLGCGTPPCNATHVSVTDIHPAGFPGQPWGTPNQLVDINDVFAIILGFQGNEFPGPAIDQCP